MRMLQSWSVGLIGLISFAALLQAGERPTLVHTNDPRPDIIPRPFYENYTEYRARYNRPTYIGGFLAHSISRTSQEAMSWKENCRACNYDKHHMPPMYKTYYYPKPWEVLQTGARPDFANSKPKSLSNPAAAVEQIQMPYEEATTPTAEEPSPADEVTQPAQPTGWRPSASSRKNANGLQ